MSDRRIGVAVSITQYVSDDPQSGIVECEFLDVHGCRWCFTEKIAIVTAEHLDSRTNYPQPGVFACEIVARKHDDRGRLFMVIGTKHPWGV